MYLRDECVMKGKLLTYISQGDDDPSRVFVEDGVAGFEGTHWISPGDYLRVWDEAGRVLFDEEVRAGTFWKPARGPQAEWFERGLRAELDKRTPRAAPPFR